MPGQRISEGVNAGQRISEGVNAGQNGKSRTSKISAGTGEPPYVTLNYYGDQQLNMVGNSASSRTMPYLSYPYPITGNPILGNGARSILPYPCPSFFSGSSHLYNDSRPIPPYQYPPFWIRGNSFPESVPRPGPLYPYHPQSNGLENGTAVLPFSTQTSSIENGLLANGAEALPSFSNHPYSIGGHSLLEDTLRTKPPYLYPTSSNATSPLVGNTARPIRPMQNTETLILGNGARATELIPSPPPSTAENRPSGNGTRPIRPKPNPNPPLVKPCSPPTNYQPIRAMLEFRPAPPGFLFQIPPPAFFTPFSNVRRFSGPRPEFTPSFSGIFEKATFHAGVPETHQEQSDVSASSSPLVQQQISGAHRPCSSPGTQSATSSAAPPLITTSPSPVPGSRKQPTRINSRSAASLTPTVSDATREVSVITSNPFKITVQTDDIEQKPAEEQDTNEPLGLVMEYEDISDFEMDEVVPLNNRSAPNGIEDAAEDDANREFSPVGTAQFWNYKMDIGPEVVAQVLPPNGPDPAHTIPKRKKYSEDEYEYRCDSCGRWEKNYFAIHCHRWEHPYECMSYTEYHLGTFWAHTECKFIPSIEKRITDTGLPPSYFL